MSGYNYPDDGKLHTRYSELVRCTPGQIDRVVYERREGIESFANQHTLDGTERHEMFADESRLTGRTPRVFAREIGVDMPLSHIEAEFASEIFPGIVLHSRLDAVSAVEQTVIDYKTITGSPLSYAASKQLRVYAFQLAMHQIRVREGRYLFEIWSPERTRIEGYHQIHFTIPLLDITAARDWLRPRCALLKTVLNEREASNV